MLDEKLLESLINLSRAIQGNEDLITNKTTSLIQNALVTNNSKLISDIEEERKRIIPDCYTCKVNCGRNANYDILKLKDKNEKIKLEIIAKLIILAKTTDNIQTIYNALFIVGMNEWNYNELLNQINNEIKITS